jgi:two-component system cell cycle response regulator DivK
MPVRVLCVEDNPQNMRLVRKILFNAGYLVLEAQDGASGLAVVRAEKPDIILMDVNLPDIDGLEITKQIKADPELARIPLLALTANAMHGDRDRCLKAGCDGYIPKPITKTELLGTVASFVRHMSLGQTQSS